MKKFIKAYSTYIIITIIISTLVGCGSNKNLDESKNSIEKTNIVSTKISANEAKEIINNEEDVIILDVRTLEEYSSGHIINSILIPVDELGKDSESKLKDKNQKILVYCRSGNRSNKAAKILVDLGYTKVYDFGGINNWNGEIVK